MVKHVIIWTLKSEYSDSEKRAAAEKIKSGLEGLAGRIPGMTSVKVNISTCCPLPQEMLCLIRNVPMKTH